MVLGWRCLERVIAQGDAGFELHSCVVLAQANRRTPLAVAPQQAEVLVRQHLLTLVGWLAAYAPETAASLLVQAGWCRLLLAEQRPAAPALRQGPRPTGC